METNTKPRSFITGAAVLGLSGFLVKVIGAFYRVPLTNIIGADGIALYQIAYNIYAFLLMISTSGLPAAISRQVAEKLALGDRLGAHRTFTLSMKVLLILGFAATAIILAGHRLFAGWMGNEDAGLAVLAISPSLFFVACISAYRGYFQGMQHMTPTAASQVVEQIGKLAIGLWLAAKFLPRGPQYGAAGALVGVTVAEAAALLLLLGIYLKKRGTFRHEIDASAYEGKQDSSKKILRRLAAIAVPITIGACITPIVNLIDTTLVINRLVSIGHAREEALKLFGILTGAVNTLANMPSVFTTALSIALVPALSSAKTLKSRRSVRRISQIGLKLSILIGLPCAVGLWLLAKPIISMLYSVFTPEQVGIAAQMLGTMSIAVFFLSTLQAMSGTLQGLGRANIPVINLLIGAVLKIIVNYILLGIPSIGVLGAPVGTVVCYGTAAVLNIIAAKKYSRMRFNYMDMLVRPLIATAAMGLTVVGCKYVIGLVTQRNAIITLGCVFAGVIVYLAAAILVKAISPEDMDFIPGGGRLRRLLNKAHIWREK